MKSCENCLHKFVMCCNKEKPCEAYKPDYYTLKSINTELIRLLEKIKDTHCGLFCRPDHDGICKEINEVLGRVKG